MENREQAEQAAVGWLARRETGSWSEADAAAFEHWLAGSTTRKIAYYRFKKTWQEAGRLRALGDGPLPERVLSGAFDAQEAAATTRQDRGIPVRYALLACVVLSVAAALFMFHDDISGSHGYHTAVGDLTTVPMADGSRVTLNTDSALRISVNDRERRIDLERGEAFFDVAKDPDRPFIVAVGDTRIVAVGTRFAVRRQSDDTRVSVTEGAVRFITSPLQAPQQAGSASRTARLQEGLLLTAGAVARAESTGVVMRKEPLAMIEQQLTWRAGILTFHETPLMDAVAEFNRYNRRKIFIEDPNVAAIQIGGVFRSTDLDPFLRLIEDSLALQVSRDGNHILISGRKGV